MKPRDYNLIILSAEHSDNTWQNNSHTTENLSTILSLLKLDYMPVYGQYKGKPENSFLVKVTDPISDTLHILEWLAFKVFNQESILIVDTQDKATLIFKDKHEESCGTWTEVTHPGASDHTKIGQRYFIAQ